MKRTLTTIFLVFLSPALLASGAGSINQRSPHDQAVELYNSGEKRLEKLTKMHDEMKASTDPQKTAQMQQKIAKGLEDAEADFERATLNDPNLYQAYSELGFTLRKLGKYSESLDAYDKALDLQPGFSPAVEYRAEAMLGLNQLDEVKKAYTTLFGGDRPKADALMVSMKSWLADRRASPAAVDAQKLDEFAKWMEQRESIAGLTTPVASASTFRSW